MSAPFYRDLDPDLSQGDVVDGVPHLRLRSPLEIVRRVTLRGGRASWAPYPYPPVAGQTPDAAGPGKTIDQPPFHLTDGEHVPVLARFTRAVVLNYECDLVHEEDHCLVVIVRPMTVVHEEDRPTIRENRNFNHFYLPADQRFGLEEGYADFRQVTCLEPAVIEAVGKRLTSLTPGAVQALQAALFRFLTRRDLIPPSPATPPGGAAPPGQIPTRGGPG